MLNLEAFWQVKKCHTKFNRLYSNRTPLATDYKLYQMKRICIVEAVEKKFKNQIQFWSLLGPGFILLSIAVLLFKISSHWYVPLSALVGIPLCVKWKMRGMAASLCTLLFLAAFSVPGLELDEQYWHVGLSLAMAFSFIVLTLSLEEAQGLVSKLQTESRSRLENCILLDEKWKTAEREKEAEKETSQSLIHSISQSLTKVTQEKQTFYKLAHLAKDELIQVRNQHDLLLNANRYKSQQIVHLQERLDTSEHTVQQFIDTDAEKEIRSLKIIIENIENETKALKTTIGTVKEELLEEKTKGEQEQLLLCHYCLGSTMNHWIRLECGY